MNFTTKAIPRTKERREKAEIPLGFSFDSSDRSDFSFLPVDQIQTCPCCGSYLIPKASTQLSDTICPFCKSNIPSSTHENPLFFDFNISDDHSSIIKTSSDKMNDSCNISHPRTIIIIDSNFIPKASTILPIIWNILKKNQARNFAIAILSSTLTFLTPNGKLVTFSDLTNSLQNPNNNSKSLDQILPPSIFHPDVSEMITNSTLDFFSSSVRSFSGPDLISTLQICAPSIGENGKLIFFLSGMPHGIISFDRYSISSEIVSLHGPNYKQVLQTITQLYHSQNAIIEGFISGKVSRLLDVASLARLCEPLGGRIMYINDTQYYKIEELLADFFSKPISITSIKLSDPQLVSILPSIGMSHFDPTKFSCVDRCLFFPLKVTSTLTSPFYIQSVSTLIYINGKIINRVQSAIISVTDDLSLSIKCADQKVILKYVTEKILEDIMENNVCFQQLHDRVLSILKPIYSSYRLNISQSPHRLETLVMPNTLEYLPIYCLGILKSPALSAGENIDERAFQIQRLNQMNPEELVTVGYPIMVDITSKGNYNSRIKFQNFEQTKNALFQGFNRLALTKDQIPNGHIIVLFDGIGSWIHLDQFLSKELCLKFFGKPSTYLLKSVEDIQPLDTDESQRLFSFLKGNIRLIIDRDDPVNVFDDRLIEDSTLTQISYDSWLKKLNQISMPCVF